MTSTYADSPRNRQIGAQSRSKPRVPRSGVSASGKSRANTDQSEARVRREVAAAFSELRPELKRLIAKYLDRRLKHRIDASDVAQNAYLDVHDRLARYLRERPMAVRPWLFFLAKMKTLETNQYHLASQKRDPKREQALRSAATLLRDQGSTPSRVMSREETRQSLKEAIDRLPKQYRSIIQLRHLEHRTNQEAAAQLGVTANAASKLYIRALNALQRDLGRD